MFIIWGSRGRVKDVSFGEFHCPQCDQARDYVHKRAKRYFTLYWIPLFPTETLGEFIECRGCGGQFTPEVLEHRPPSREEILIGIARGELEKGLPLHMIEQRMINGGVHPDLARDLADRALGDSSNVCQTCGHVYADVIPACSNCGAVLERLNMLE